MLLNDFYHHVLKYIFLQSNARKRETTSKNLKKKLKFLNEKHFLTFFHVSFNCIESNTSSFSIERIRKNHTKASKKKILQRRRKNFLTCLANKKKE